MQNNPEHKSLRLKGYDYTQAGGYFITICTKNRMDFFGNIKYGEIILNTLGKIVESEWLRTQSLRKEITLDDYIIMPNHLHGIIIIDYSLHLINQFPVGADGRPLLRRDPGSLGSIIAGFKSSATKKINIIQNTPGKPVWQRGYYDRIIRNPEELDRIRTYIRNNPQNASKGQDSLSG